MTVSYNIDKIKKIIDDLHEITGLSLGFMDTEFRYIYRKLKEKDEYCTLINSTKIGRNKCLCSDNDMTKKCAETLKPVSHICHAGVIDTTVPVLKHGILSGFIIIGRIRRDDTEGLREKLLWLGDEVENTLPYYNDLAYFSPKQLESLIDIISNTIFETAIIIKHNNIADTATEYINKNLQSRLSIEELCAALFTSKNRLYSAFSQAYGMTVNEYVTTRRIERAKELLCETEKTITEIAEEVGVGNSPYFSDLFKKRCGVTPRKFRENSRKQT